MLHSKVMTLGENPSALKAFHALEGRGNFTSSFIKVMVVVDNAFATLVFPRIFLLKGSRKYSARNKSDYEIGKSANLSIIR